MAGRETCNRAVAARLDSPGPPCCKQLHMFEIGAG